MKKDIAVIGLGNLLLQDEGFGIHLIRFLKKHYEFGDNVDIIDGGTIGFQLIEYFLSYKNLIFIDAIKSSDKPGTVYKFNVKELPPNITFVSSIHEIGLGDVLSRIEFMGENPNAEVVGVVPLHMCPNQLTENLSDFMNERIEPVSRVVLQEIKKLGGSYA